MLKKELQNKIELMREELYDLIDYYGTNSQIVVDYSQQLDEKLCEFERKDN